MKRVFPIPAALFLGATFVAGCGAGSTLGGGPSPVIVATATATPTPAGISTTPAGTSTTAPPTTASPSKVPATATPSPAPGTTATGSTPVPGTTPEPGNTLPIYHPADNGDEIGMSGAIVTTYQRPDATPDPEPTQTTLDSVTQTTTVTNPASFAGDSGAVDFHTVETDQQTAPAAQTFTETIDNYYAFSDDIYTGNFNNLGYSSTDDSGYSVTYTFGSGNGLADILPEASGATWTNDAAATIAVDAADDETSTQTYNADGSYVETINYQNVNAQGPTTTATVHSNLDGTGLLNTPRLGTELDANYTYAVASPSAAGSSGTITETTTIPVAPGSAATPEVVTTTVPNWIPTGKLGVSLASETDTDMGSVTLPSGCAIPASFGTTANKIVQVKSLIDPMFGQTDDSTTTTYDLANVGPVCVTLVDEQKDYYDFSGQNGTGYFSGTPQQITDVAETLFLTSEQLMSAARKPQARTQVARGFALRITTAENRIAAARIEQRSKLMRTFLTPAPGRGRAFSTHRGIF